MEVAIKEIVTIHSRLSPPFGAVFAKSGTARLVLQAYLNLVIKLSPSQQSGSLNKII